MTPEQIERLIVAAENAAYGLVLLGRAMHESDEDEAEENGEAESWIDN